MAFSLANPQSAIRNPQYRLFCLLLSAYCFLPAAHAAEDPYANRKPVDVHDQPVCMVNTEAISKREVEERMGDIYFRLKAFKDEQERAGLWNDEVEKKWFELYVPAFTDELRKVIKERLMLQAAATEKLTVDEKDLEKRYLDTMDKLRKGGESSFSSTDVRKRVKENMLLNQFQNRYFYSVLNSPTRPEVEAYYKEHLSRYQRKAGVKVRLVRVDRFTTNQFTGKQQVRADAWDEADKLRQNVVEYGANFTEVARLHSDDLDARARGGLLLSNSGDSYVIPEESSPQLAKAIRGLKPGEVSQVFEYSEKSCAFALVEDMREAGPAPLEGAIYDDAYKTLQNEKSRKAEDEWLRKTVGKAFIAQVREGLVERLPPTFFFPDDQPATQTAQTPKK